MKTVWQLRYETIFGNGRGEGEKIKKYRSFDEAKDFIRQIVSDVYVIPYADMIRGEGKYQAFRNTVADFLVNKQKIAADHGAFHHAGNEGTQRSTLNFHGRRAQLTENEHPVKEDVHKERHNGGIQRQLHLPHGP